MALYKKRLAAPSATDKNWIHYTLDGYNYCIQIPGTGGSTLPNCVGYAWGRWREILGKFHELSRGNAEVWWGKKDGYERSQTPRLGSVACWRKGSANMATDGAGHVAIVEEIHADGSITISNSDYGGTRFYTKKLKKGFALAGLTFQGFIHLPGTWEEEKPAKKTNEEIAAEVEKGLWDVYPKRKTKLEAAGYNYEEIQAIVNKNIKQDHKPPTPNRKTNEQLAEEVRLGLWGNGEERRKRLTEAGYNYQAVQDIVNSGAKKTRDLKGTAIKMGIGTVLRDTNGSPYSLKLQSRAFATVLSQIGDGISGKTLLRFKASWLIGVSEAYVYLSDVTF